MAGNNEHHNNSKECNLTASLKQSDVYEQIQNLELLKYDSV